MSRRTIRVMDLMCDARNWQGCINAVQKELLRYNGVPDWHSKTEAEDEVRRWSQKRDWIVAKLRLLLDQLDERERQYLIKHSNPDLDIRMRVIGIELAWWKNRNAQDAANLAIQTG